MKIKDWWYHYGIDFAKSARNRKNENEHKK